MPTIAIGQVFGVPMGTPHENADLAAVAARVQDTPGDVVLATRDEDARLIARSVRLMLGAERVGLLHTPVPTTAWFTALVACSVAPPDQLGLVGGIAGAVLRQTRSRVIMSSVTALDQPNPSFSQHLASLRPGSAFLVDLGERTVTSCHDRVVVDGALVVVARSTARLVTQADADWPTNRVELTDQSGGHAVGVGPEWPARRWIEVTTVRNDPRAVAGSVIANPYVLQRCAICGRVGAGGPCIFCAVLPARSRSVEPQNQSEQGVLA